MPRGDSYDIGGMLDDLKSRLGFTRNDDESFDRYDADFNDYDDFDDDYDYYDRYDSGNGRYDEYGTDGYDPSYRTGDSTGAYRPATARSQAGSSRLGSLFGASGGSGASSPASERSGYRSRSGTSPHLVSFDDVKAHTQVPDSLLRDPLSSSQDRSYTATTVGGRSVIDNTAPAPSSIAHQVQSRESATLTTPSGVTFDPYVAYSSNTPTSHTPLRSLSVIKPVAYSDVERVAKAVKSGDVVVLAMRNTPDDLSKRILDFSFGVASALDASVECPAEKVFAISRGSALTEDEKRNLRNQGVL